MQTSFFCQTSFLIAFSTCLYPSSLFGLSAPVDERDGQGETVLTLAAKHASLDSPRALSILQHYKKNKLWVDQCNKYGNTPVIEATIANNSTSLSLLIASRAELDTQNFARKTALHYAAEMRNTHAAIMLIQAGANPTIPDDWGITSEQIIMARHIQRCEADAAEALLQLHKS